MHTLPQGLTIDEVLEAAERDDGTGFCLVCGEEQDGCEPDMSHGTCESCGSKAVHGAAELILLFA